MKVKINPKVAVIAGPALLVLGYSGARLFARPTADGTTKAVIGKQTDGTYLVPTGQTIRPVGDNFTFNSRPVDMALSPDGATLALMLPSSIKFFDVAANKFRENSINSPHTFGGICWSSDGKTLYSTGRTRSADGTGQAGCVYIMHFGDDHQLTQGKPIQFVYDSGIEPNKASKESVPSGLALSPDGTKIYVTLFNNGTLAVVDLKSYDPESGTADIIEIPVGSSPEKVLISAAGDRLYVANRGGKRPEAGDTTDTADPVVVDPDTYKASTGTISVIQTNKIATDGDSAVIKTIVTGLQPADLAISPNGKFLYSANANSDTVSVIDISSSTVVETIPTSPAPGRLAASCPNGLTTSPDGKSLYVTLGGDNAVEVITLSIVAGGNEVSTKIAGLIPTAWFPLRIVRDPAGRRLFIANSKGIGSLGDQVKKPKNENAATPEAGPGGVITGDVLGHSVYSVMGSLSVVQTPDSKTLAKWTSQVERTNHFDRMARVLHDRPDPFWSRFKHVILVIKENRTYDQILGDIKLPPGHIGGEPNLVMFGENVTPNQHAIAHEFGIFDNIYCSGAISADGHHWLNEAFASDYSERAMNNYPRSYPCCGTDPLVYAGNKFIWQAAIDAKRTFRNYGEFGPLPSMQKYSEKKFDSGLPPITAERNRDVSHAEVIIADIKAGEAGDAKRGLPDLTFTWFGNNHTAGTRPGAYTPEVCVADNDLGLGKLVDTITHSKKYWQDEPTAIFVIEDDAQGGLDHIEGHRTTGFIISPFNKRGQIVSTNYNQLNILRTMELILGLQPLNQFDAAAIPMRECFQDKADYKPFTFIPARFALNLKNPSIRRTSQAERHWALESMKLDFSEPDKADPEKLTEILWHHTHGNAAYPPASAAVW